MMRSILHLLSLGFLAMSWLVPHHLPPWTAYHTEAPAFFAAALVAVALLVSNTKVRFESIPIVAVGLALLAWIQWATGLVSYAGDAWVATAYCGLFTIAWYWSDFTQVKGGAGEFIKHLQVVLLGVGLLVAFQLLSQALLIHDQFGDLILEPIPGGRSRANVGQPNQAATTIVLAIISGCALHAQKVVRGPILAVTLIVLTMALTTTQSRTGLLSSTVSFFFLLWVGRSGRIPIRYKLWALLWVISTQIAAWVYARSAANLLSSPALSADALMSSGTRPVLWGQFVLSIIERPFLGWGWAHISTAQQFGALSFPSSEQTNYAHNIILDAFVMFGIPIGIMAIAAVTIWFWMRWMEYRFDKHRAWVFALLLPLAIHSMLEFPHAYAYFLLLIAALMGALKSRDGSEIDGTGVRVNRVVVVSVGLFWIIIIGVLAREYSLVEEDFRINRFENRRIGITSPDYHVPKLYILTQLSDLLRAMRLRATPNMNIDEVLLLERISGRYSWAPLMFRSILANALNGRSAVASRQLLVLRSLFPLPVYEEAINSIEVMADREYPQLRYMQIPY